MQSERANSHRQWNRPPGTPVHPEGDPKGASGLHVGSPGDHHIAQFIKVGNVMPKSTPSEWTKERKEMRLAGYFWETYLVAELD